MRRAPVLPLIAIALLVLAPSASAAGAFELVGGRIVERALDPGNPHAFRLDVDVNQAGFLYLKLLATPGNAVHDGSQANGSVAEGVGWRIAFAFERADGAVLDLGERDDSTPTDLLPVAQGERVTLRMTTHVPASATEGGPSQRVYVAVAYRLDAGGAGPGGASGAQMDEARSVTLLHSNALLPPVVGGGAPPADDEEIPPVGPIPEESTSGAPTVIVNSPGLPTWFLMGILLLGAAAVALLAGVVVLLARIERGLARRRTAVEPSREPRQVPVATEAAREFLATLRRKP